MFLWTSRLALHFTQKEHYEAACAEQFKKKEVAAHIQ